MKKIISIFIMTFLLFSCGNDKKNETNTTKKQTIKKEIVINKNFGQLNNFIKKDLKDDDLKKLNSIYKERLKLLKILKQKLKNANKDNREKLFEEIKKKREEMMKKFIPYIEKEKQTEFSMFCGKYNNAIKKALYKK